MMDIPHKIEISHWTQRDEAGREVMCSSEYDLPAVLVGDGHEARGVVDDVSRSEPRVQLVKVKAWRSKLGNLVFGPTGRPCTVAVRPITDDQELFEICALLCDNDDQSGRVLEMLLERKVHRLRTMIKDADVPCTKSELQEALEIVKERTKQRIKYQQQELHELRTSVTHLRDQNKRLEEKANVCADHSNRASGAIARICALVAAVEGLPSHRHCGDGEWRAITFEETVEDVKWLVKELERARASAKDRSASEEGT